VQVAAGILQGARLRLDLQAEKDYWLGTYEPELQLALRHFVRPGWVAYDLGANIGYLSLMLARLVGTGGHVFAVEALPANLERLRQNLALNHLQSTVEVVAAAVTDQPGLVQFLVGPSIGMGKAAGSAGRESIDYTEQISVLGLSLDDFVYAQGNPPPQVVKMDIEGGELLALPGMRRLLREARPLLFLELHGPEAARIAWQVLTQAGYSLCRMSPGYPLLPALEQLDWKAYLVARPPGWQEAG
jgi:FkbM family methyltransferase